jgi:Fur family ferric uptake transcriptional regulator
MSHDQQKFADQLRDKGYRLTLQRQLILDALCELGGHAAIGDVYDRVHAQSSAVDRATVYRTLHLFHELGFVVSADINGSTVYEIADHQPHHHLVCRECGHVTALHDHHFVALAEHLFQEHGFRADINHMTIDGVCHHCR